MDTGTRGFGIGASLRKSTQPNSAEHNMYLFTDVHYFGIQIIQNVAKCLQLAQLHGKDGIGTISHPVPEAYGRSPN